MMKRMYLLLSAISLAVSLLGGYPAPGQVQAAPTELFLSEYVEGSSNNKALEIYNGTGSAVDLAADSYNVQMFFDGSASDELTSVYLPLVLIMTSKEPPGVYVLDNHTTYTSGSNLRVVGEVFNNTPKIVNAIKISVNFFNSGQLVGTGSSYADLDILYPYEKTCFNITLQNNPVWNQYSFEPVSYSDIPQSTRPLISVVSHSGGVFITYYYRIKGQVRNDEAVTVVYPRIYATLYNSSGKVIMCGAVSALEYTLSPGQMSDFSLTTIPSNPNEVESYTLKTTGNFTDSSSEKNELLPRE